MRLAGGEPQNGNVGLLTVGYSYNAEVDQIDRGLFFFWGGGGINFHLELLCNVEMNFASAFSFYKWASEG